VGKHVDIVASTEEGFRSKFRQYVHTSFSFWPIVKACRVYTRSDVLSSGAVLIDFPGSNDVNSARSHASETAMAQCDYLFVVTEAVQAADTQVTAGEPRSSLHEF
jgi:hypothetical protein